MNLENKEIDIEFMSSNMVTGESVVTVSISKEVAPEILQKIGTYKLSFAASTFTSMDDPQLLIALQERLSVIPEPV
jgi:hypothetical protein